MAKIMIGDYLVHPSDIVSISERDVTLSVKIKKPNPKPKPNGLFGKAFYSSTVTVMEKHKYHILVLKVAAGTQAVLPDPDDHSDFSVGRGSYGTHQVYKFYTICDNAKFVTDAKALKKELDNVDFKPTEERRSSIIKSLTELGMDRALYGWVDPDYLDTSVMIDKTIKSKQEFIDKYM